MPSTGTGSVVRYRPTVRPTTGTGPSPTTPGSTAGDAVRTTVAMALLAVATPLVVVDWTRNSASTTNILLAFTITVIAAARLSRMIGTGRPDLVRAFFYLFVYIFLGVAALAQIVSGTFPQDARSYLDETITQGLVVVLVGIVGYEVGWFLRNRVARDAATGARRAARWHLYFSRPRTVALGLLGLAATAYQIGTNGITSFFLSRSDTTALLTGSGVGSNYYREADKTGGLLLAFVSQVPLFVALFVILYCRHHKLWPAPRNMVTDAVWRMFIVALVVANVIINNPIGNARFWACLLAFAFISIYLPYLKQAAIRGYIAIALGILLFVFTALDLFRTQKSASGFRLSGPGTSLVSDETYGMFQMVLNGIQYVNDHGNTWGHQLLGSVFGFVPRQLWESKPIATGQLVDPKNVRSAPMWTEFHVDFGVIGVLLLFAVVGVGAAAVTRRAALARPGVLHAVVPVLAVFQIFLFRGSLLPAFGPLYQLVGVFAVIAGAHRLLPAEQGPARGPAPAPSEPSERIHP